MLRSISGDLGSSNTLRSLEARKFEELSDKIFKCVHPSPLSAYRGFFGCEIFKKINW